MEEEIKANAERVVQEFGPISGIHFGYNHESVEWLDGYIQRLRQSDVFDEATRKKLTIVFGSFLGECVVKCYGGKWEQQKGDWCVAFGSRDLAFPFAKVAKQMEGEPYQSIASFFRLIPILFPKVVGSSPPQRKAWWKFW
jgi:hypothetical protein